MAKISLVRLDDRLIHGQVVTKWVQRTNSDKIIIADNELAKNTYLAQIFKMAAPAGVEVETKSTTELAEDFKATKLGDGNVMILFKNVTALKEAYENGFVIENVQIAGLGAGPGKKVVFRTVSLSEEDAKQLKQLSEAGVEVVFQSIPDEKSASLDAVLKKYFKNL